MAYLEAPEKPTAGRTYPYDLSVTDPETKKVSMRAFSAARPLSKLELSQIAAAHAVQAKVPREAVAIREGGTPVESGQTPGARLLETTLPTAAYAALGAIPQGRIATSIGGWLAKHPQVLGALLRSAGATGISELSGEGTSGGLAQLGFEAVGGPATMALQRGGSRALRNLEDKTATQLMDLLKKVVPYTKSLPDGQKGIAALVHTGEGPALFSQEYGKAIEAVKDRIPLGTMASIAIDDAKKLGLSVGERIGSETPSEEIALVPVEKLMERVSGLWKKDPGLSVRTMEAIDGALPATLGAEFEQARGLFREAAGFTNMLKASDAYDPVIGRLNITHLTVGSRMPTGKAGEAPKSPVERYMKGPQLRQAMQDIISPTGQAPRAAGVWRPYVSMGGHAGLASPSGEQSIKGIMTQSHPALTSFSKFVPATEFEEQVRQVTPGAAHAAAKAMGASP